MAQTWLYPKTCCTVVASGSVIGSEGQLVWLGLTADADNAASAAFYRSASATQDKHLWSLAATCRTSTPMVGPFAAPCGVYVTLAGTNASAIVAMTE